MGFSGSGGEGGKKKDGPVMVSDTLCPATFWELEICTAGHRLTIIGPGLSFFHTGQQTQKG